MHIKQSNSPLIVIVGETASGKSALAVALAKHLGGEIICADSRTVYTGMDIGTAKPAAGDRRAVPHHGLDLVTPDMRYSAADFKQYAVKKIDEIAERGSLPILVGGTGLYIDGVLYNFEFRAPADPEFRKQLETLQVDELQARLQTLGIALPNNAQNRRHLIRSLETNGEISRKSTLRANTLIFGIQSDREILHARITARVEAMISAGFIEEAESLGIEYGWDAPGLQAPGYRAFRGYVQASDQLETAKSQFVRNDLNLAKRQRTWFKRNKSIHWLMTEDKWREAVDIATTFLNK